MMSDDNILSSRGRTDTKAFYDQRYTKGYMEQWPKWKTERVRLLIESLPLPQKGTALDFGCGNGVFTEILRLALPGWKIYGSDLSDIAVSQAKDRFPQCTFFQAWEYGQYAHFFDLAFSHHVFEHVPDPQPVLHQIANALKPNSYMFHIMPCGNPGSLEYHICQLRTDGFDTENGNRFFFEDEGHLRRFTSNQFAEQARPGGFVLVQEFYANQYHGMFHWIHHYRPAFKMALTDPAKASNANAAKELLSIRRKLFPGEKVRAFLERYSWWVDNPNKKLKQWIAICGGAPLSKLAHMYFRYLDWKRERLAKREWRRNNRARNGSEMYLFFSRDLEAAETGSHQDSDEVI